MCQIMAAAARRPLPRRGYTDALMHEGGGQCIKLLSQSKLAPWFQTLHSCLEPIFGFTLYGSLLSWFTGETTF